MILRIHTSDVSQLEKIKQQKIQRKKKGYHIPIQDHPASSRIRRSLLLSVVGNIYMAVCRDMAI